MIVLMLTGRRSGAYEHRLRLRRELVGLRAALVAELNGLLAAYDLNAQSLAAGGPHMIPARPYFSAYRGNMNRLINLPPAEVAAVVAAHAAADTLDAAAQIASPVPRRRPNEPAPAERCMLDVRVLLADAAAAALAARDILAAGEAEVQAGWLARIRQWMAEAMNKARDFRAGDFAPGPGVPARALTRQGLRPQTQAGENQAG
jgi:hypothetical protein